MSDKDLKYLLTALEEALQHNYLQIEKRNAIIAEGLGWKLYHVSINSEQMAYGPDEETVKREIGWGDKLSKLIDKYVEEYNVQA